jgi:hypothetical protein
MYVNNAYVIPYNSPMKFSVHRLVLTMVSLAASSVCVLQGVLLPTYRQPAHILNLVPEKY